MTVVQRDGTERTVTVDHATGRVLANTLEDAADPHETANHRDDASRTTGTGTATRSARTPTTWPTTRPRVSAGDNCVLRGADRERRAGDPVPDRERRAAQVCGRRPVGGPTWHDARSGSRGLVPRRPAGAPRDRRGLSMRNDTVAALADAEPRVFWLDSPTGRRRGRRLHGVRPHRPRRRRRRLLRPVDRAAGQGARPRPRRRAARGRADRLGGHAAATAGSARRASPTARPTAWRAGPHEYPTLRAARPREPRRDRGDGGALRHRVRLRRTGSLTSRPRPPGRVAAEAASGAASSWTRTRSARSCDSPTYLGGRVGPRRHARWWTRPGWPGGWPRRPRRLGVRIVEHTPVRRLSTRSGRWSCAPPTGRPCTPTGSPRAPTPSRRLLRANAAAHRPGLRLRPDDRAADRRPAGRDRLGATGRASATLGQPVPLLPAHRRQPDPVGRLRRDLPLRPRGSARATTSGPATFDRLAGHFFETFPQLEGLRFTHRWGGAIDTCTRFCAFYGTAHSRPRRPTRSGFTGLGVGRDPVRRRRDARPADRRSAPSAPSCRWCAQKPLPFPPEPLAYAGHPAHPLVAGARRPRRGPSQPLAAGPRPGGAGLRLLSRTSPRRRRRCAALRPRPAGG